MGFNVSKAYQQKWLGLADAWAMVGDHSMRAMINDAVVRVRGRYIADISDPECISNDFNTITTAVLLDGAIDSDKNTVTVQQFREGDPFTKSLYVDVQVLADDLRHVLVPTYVGRPKTLDHDFISQYLEEHAPGWKRSQNAFFETLAAAYNTKHGTYPDESNLRKQYSKTFRNLAVHLRLNEE